MLLAPDGRYSTLPLLDYFRPKRGARMTTLVYFRPERGGGMTTLYGMTRFRVIRFGDQL